MAAGHRLGRSAVDERLFALADGRDIAAVIDQLRELHQLELDGRQTLWNLAAVAAVVYGPQFEVAHIASVARVPLPNNGFATRWLSLVTAIFTALGNHVASRLVVGPGKVRVLLDLVAGLDHRPTVAEVQALVSRDELVREALLSPWTASIDADQTLTQLRYLASKGDDGVDGLVDRQREPPSGAA